MLGWSSWFQDRKCLADHFTVHIRFDLGRITSVISGINAT